MTEIRAGGHLHVEPSIYLAGLPYFHDDIRQDFFYYYSRPTSKEIKTQKTTYATSKSQRQRFPEETDHFWTFSLVAPNLGHFTESWNNFDWKCSCTSSALPPCSKQGQRACSGPGPLKLWKSVFKKLDCQAMSAKPPWRSALTQIF